MAKKPSGSFPRGKQISAGAESMWSKPPTKARQAALRKIAKQQRAGDESDIDYSDIPALTDKQLKEFRRPVKKVVAIRLDPDILEWLQRFGEGYSGRINSILRAVMERSK